MSKISYKSVIPICRRYDENISKSKEKWKKQKQNIRPRLTEMGVSYTYFFFIPRTFCNKFHRLVYVWRNAKHTHTHPIRIAKINYHFFFAFSLLLRILLMVCISFVIVSSYITLKIWRLRRKQQTYRDKRRSKEGREMRKVEDEPSEIDEGIIQCTAIDRHTYAKTTYWAKGIFRLVGILTTIANVVAFVSQQTWSFSHHGYFSSSSQPPQTTQPNIRQWICI